MRPATPRETVRRNRVLGVFAKWPQPGAAKTRLGAEGVQVARAFLLDTLQRLAAVDAQRIVAFAPSECAAEFAALVAGRYALTPQGEGDLGRRLAAFFGGQVSSGARAVVVVGTDSPTLPVEYVEDAFAKLEDADVVLGPATDGGYYLVGCRPDHPRLFEGVAWGTASVLADTIAALSDPRWRLAVLPPWYDVDTPDDWAMLLGHLAASRRAGIDPGVPHTEALVRLGACE